MRRASLLNAGLLIFGLLFGLVLCEGALRILFPQEIQTMETTFFVQYDPQIGWVNRPGDEGIHQPVPEARPVSVRINSHGMRGSEVSVEKPGGVRRVLAIGDSNTFGYRLEEQQAFVSLLERRLGDCYEVLNMGVISYGTGQEYMLLEREGRKFSPDIVVLGFSAGNDLVDNTSKERYGYPKPFFTFRDGRLEAQNIPVPERESPQVKEFDDDGGLRRTLFLHSHLYRLLSYSFWLRPVFEGSDHEPAVPFDEALPLTMELFKRVKELSENMDAQMMVVMIPDGSWLEAARSTGNVRGGDFFKELLEDSGVRYLDLWDIFLDAERRGYRLYIEGDPVHMNADGNALAAQRIYDYLYAYGMIGKCPKGSP